MNGHKAPSAVKQSVTIKLSTNAKSIQIWHRLNVQFTNDTLWRSQECKWYKLSEKSREEGEIRRSNMAHGTGKILTDKFRIYGVFCASIFFMYVVHIMHYSNVNF